MSIESKIFLGVFILIILFPLISNLSGGYSILGGDVSFFQNNFSNFYYYWQKIGSQNFSYANIAYFSPLGLVANLFMLVGIPLSLLNNFILAIIFIITFIGAHFLFNEIFDYKSNNLAIIASTVLVLFNGYTLFNWSAPDPFIVMAYSSCIWLLYVFIKGFKKESALKWAIIFSLVGLFFASGFINLPFLVIFWGIITAYLIWDLIFYRKNIKRKFIYFFLCFLSFFIFNLWWLGIIPFYTQEGLEGSERLDIKEWIESRAESSSLIKLSKLEGYYKWHRVEDGEYYLGFQKIYAENKIINYLKYIFVLSIIPFLIINKRKKFVDNKSAYLFVFLFGIYVFFAKSIHPPFGFINQWMYNHIPLFIIFRSGVIKFGIIGALSLSILWGMFIYTLSQLKLFNKYFKYILIWILIFLPLLIYFPFFMGNLISDGSGFQVLYKQKIPNYYFDFANYINKNTEEEAIFMLFPSHRSTWVETSWGHYGVDFFINLLNRYYINNHFVFKYHGLIYSNIFQLTDFSDIGKYFKLLKVNYLIFNDDYESITFTKEQIKDIENYVAKNLGQKIFEAGSVRLYKINNFVGEKFYASSGPRLYKNGTIAIPDYVTSKDASDFILEKENKAYLDVIKPVIIEASDRNNVVKENHWGFKPEKEEVVASNNKKSGGAEAGNIKYRLEIEKEGMYEILAHLKYSENRGDLRMRIDNNEWSDYEKFTYKETYKKQKNYVYLSTYLGNFKLDVGKHTIEFENILDPGESINLKWISIIPEKETTPTLPKIEFKKINPTKYKLKISEAENPFFLNFLENYHKFWKIYIDNEKIDEKYHYDLNGLYNTWHINKTGDFEVLISFEMQKIFYIFLIISGLSILISVFYIIKKSSAGINTSVK